MVHINNIRLGMLGLALLAAYAAGAQTKIGGTAGPGNASAVLELESTSQGLLPPRMTTTQRNAISNPATGLTIYNTTTNCIQVYKGAGNGGWFDFCSGGGDLAFTNCTTPVISGAINAQVATTATITLNYVNNTGQTHGAFVSGTVNGITLTAPGGGVTDITTGSITLTASGTPVNAGNINIPVVLAGTSCNIPVTVDAFQGNVPVACGTAPGCTGGVNPATAADGDKICWGGFEYRVVSLNGRLWFDRNLGAQAAAVSGGDVQAFGDLYQWGRKGDGHQCTIYSNGGSSNGGSGTNSPVTGIQATNPNPGNQFITIASGSYNWLNTDNTTLWENSAAGGVNNPCPPGWRVPANTEISTLTGNSMNTVLKFPWSGYRAFNTGTSTQGTASSGTYVWACATHFNNGAETKTYAVYWQNSTANRSNENFYRAYGLTVRCIKH